MTGFLGFIPQVQLDHFDADYPPNYQNVPFFVEVPTVQKVDLAIKQALDAGIGEEEEFEFWGNIPMAGLIVLVNCWLVAIEFTHLHPEIMELEYAVQLDLDQSTTDIKFGGFLLVFPWYNDEILSTFAHYMHSSLSKFGQFTAF